MLRHLDHSQIVLFVKLYDPVNVRLSYVGRCMTCRQQKLSAILPELKNLAHLPEETELEVSHPSQCKCGIWSLLPLFVVC